MGENETGQRWFSRWRGRSKSPERTAEMALTWAIGAFVLLVVGLVFDVGWTIYIVVAFWAVVAALWWVRYRRFRAQQRD